MFKSTSFLVFLILLHALPPLINAGRSSGCKPCAVKDQPVPHLIRKLMMQNAMPMRYKRSYAERMAEINRINRAKAQYWKYSIGLGLPFGIDDIAR